MIPQTIPEAPLKVTQYARMFRMECAITVNVRAPAALCFKHARTSPDFVTLLGRWMDVVREVVQAPNGLAALAQVLCYVSRSASTSSEKI